MQNNNRAQYSYKLIMLSVIMLNVVVLSVIMCNVVMLSVVAPKRMKNVEKHSNLGIFYKDFLPGFKCTTINYVGLAPCLARKYLDWGNRLR
jgi:hypothetical protein